MAVAGAAITPSLLFAFVFNSLVTAARRRVQKGVLLAIEKSKLGDGAGLESTVREPPDDRREAAPI
jgi:hypothetical protein